MDTNTATQELSKRAGWSVFMGVLTAAAGVLMILHPLATAAVSTVFIGSLFLVAAVAQLALAFGSGSAGSFFVELLFGVLYGIAGVVLLAVPLSGVLTLTVLFGATLLVQGVLQIFLVFALPAEAGRGWAILSALCSLSLGVLILLEWPSSGGWAIGTYVGISVLMSGIARIVISAAIKKEVRSIGQVPQAA